ncbi:MAG: hypothetical protein IT393_04925 [Nitrospirae bacterium]|nr:hypothetical protein [Nitrospirota bacterium]
METNMIMLMAGMLLSLAVFAVKTGYGLRSGKLKWRGISAVLILYLALFVITAIFSDRIMSIVSTVLKDRIIIPFFMLTGLALWGYYLIREKAHTVRTTWFLILPCPFLLTAAVFSSWMAAPLFDLKPLSAGLITGFLFILIALLSFRGGFLQQKDDLPVSSRMRLGLIMLGLGVYFPAAMVFPARIDEARGVFKSFLAEGAGTSFNNSIGVIAILFAAALIGFFSRKKKEGSK